MLSLKSVATTWIGERGPASSGAGRIQMSPFVFESISVYRRPSRDQSEGDFGLPLSIRRVSDPPLGSLTYNAVPSPNATRVPSGDQTGAVPVRGGNVNRVSRPGARSRSHKPSSLP